MKIPLMLCALIASATLTLPLGAQARPDTSAALQLPSVELPRDLARVLTDYETQWRFGGDYRL